MFHSDAEQSSADGAVSDPEMRQLAEEERALHEKREALKRKRELEAQQRDEDAKRAKSSAVLATPDVVSSKLAWPAHVASTIILTLLSDRHRRVLSCSCHVLHAVSEVGQDADAIGRTQVQSRGG